VLVKDHIGLPFSFNRQPERIISLVPSITELLYDLGLGDRVVGRTKFCIFPENGFPNATIIGGTKNIHLDKIEALKPDLIIANKEENTKEQVMPLSAFANVFTTVVKDTADALRMISDIGEITGTKELARQMIQTFQKDQAHREKQKTLTMAYLIWRKPYMTVGGDTFISAFMEDFGFVNCFKDRERYPAIGIAELKTKNPDIILLSSEPFPFADKHKKEIIDETGIPTELIDGSICSWYGSRMLMAKDFFETYKQQIGV